MRVIKRGTHMDFFFGWGRGESGMHQVFFTDSSVRLRLHNFGMGHPKVVRGVFRNSLRRASMTDTYTHTHTYIYIYIYIYI